jgi:hypothetical protein
MMQIYRQIFTLFLLMLTIHSLMAQTVSETKKRKYSNEFLSIGVGARSLGMSNASVVSTNDVTSGYWNPAGLLEVPSNLQVALMHSEYFAGIAKYDYLGLATKVDSNSAIGFSLIRFGVDNIPNTTQLIDKEGNVNYDKITSFSAADYAFLLSYARKLSVPGLVLGANLKVIHRRAGDFLTAWGGGLDLALKYKYKKWDFALVGRDITTTYTAFMFNLSDEMVETFIREDNELPGESSVEITMPKFIMGASRTAVIKDKFSVLGEVNLVMATDGRRNTIVSNNTFSFDPHIGVEFSYDKLVFLRGGVFNIQKIKNDVGSRKVTTFQPNIGVGVKLKNFSIDYAFTDIGDQSTALYSHVFSLKLDFFRPAN